MTAILTHVTLGEQEHELLPFAKLQGNYSDHEINYQLGQRITDSIHQMQANGMMDLRGTNFIYVHEYRRWDGRMIEDDRYNDVSITMFKSPDSLFLRRIYSPDEGYTYSFEENGGMDGSVWGMTYRNGQPIVQSIQRGGKTDDALPHYLKQPFETLLGYMQTGMKL